MKADSYKLSEKLRVFITPSDLRLIKRVAAKQRKTVSQFIRESTISAALTSISLDEERKRLAAERQLGEVSA